MRHRLPGSDRGRATVALRTAVADQHERRPDAGMRVLAALGDQGCDRAAKRLGAADQKNALASPEKASEFAASPPAVLQAESTTQSASSLSCEISDDER